MLFMLDKGKVFGKLDKSFLRLQIFLTDDELLYCIDILYFTLFGSNNFASRNSASEPTIYNKKINKIKKL